MQDLLGRITALDPDASETLKVVSYFDALVSRSVGVESKLRGAAVLSGAPVRFDDRGARLRVDAAGVRTTQDGEPHPSWPSRDVGGEATVWLERDGGVHVNDEMILERLTLALGIARARRSAGPESAVEIALSGFVGVEERLAAIARLRLPVDGMLRVVASGADGPAPAHPSAVMTTPRGLVRASIVQPDADASPAGGIGIRLPAGELPESWASALIALRLTTATEPMVDAADLGTLLTAVEAYADAPLHPDVIALAAMEERNLAVLDAIAEEPSLRAAALRLGRHHSSIQERVAALSSTLGYDPRTPRGRLRYGMARILLALVD
jgi:hypothetical protein